MAASSGKTLREAQLFELRVNRPYSIPERIGAAAGFDEVANGETASTFPQVGKPGSRL
jgi:hypothetical protein